MFEASIPQNNTNIAAEKGVVVLGFFGRLRGRRRFSEELDRVRETVRMSQWIRQKAKSWRKWLSVGVVTLLMVYGTLCGALFIVMKQTPARFATVMSKLPMVSMMVLPFESLWTIARSGDLKVGDLAPDFRLRTYEKSSWVQLSSFRGDRPVVLIFGSLTPLSPGGSRAQQTLRSVPRKSRFLRRLHLGSSLQ